MAAQPVTPVNIHNTQVLDRLRAAQAAAEQLSRRGFVLAGVEIGARNPVVWVEHTPACDGLKSAACMRYPGSVVMAAPLEGVQVQWMQRSLAS